MKHENLQRADYLVKRSASLWKAIAYAKDPKEKNLSIKAHLNSWHISTAVYVDLEPEMFILMARKELEAIQKEMDEIGIEP